ncbi:hypothetical protein [Photobacterium profundum]|uniref:hypothetical protein n=1 Tax=Photobacterium profundum TaxID=74109 RepID=UPI000310AD6A|nr:hypothetical protein [Photobacterium profundum]
MTQKGKRIHDEMVALTNEKMDEAINGLSLETLDIVGCALKNCITNLEPNWAISGLATQQ